MKAGKKARSAGEGRSCGLSLINYGSQQYDGPPRGRLMRKVAAMGDVEQEPPAIRDALGALERGDHQRAQQLCTSALQDSEQRADALHILGLLAHRRGHRRQALAFMQQAVSADPENGNRRLDLAHLANEIGAHYHAIAHMESVVAHCGEVPEALRCLGEALLSLNFPDMAADRFERAVMAARERAELWADLGHAYMACGRAEHALSALQAALRLKPEHAKYRLGFALAHIQLGHLSHAQALLETLVQHEPTGDTYWAALSLCRREQGDLQGAQNALERCLTLTSHAPEHLRSYADLALLQGDASRAWEYHFRADCKQQGGPSPLRPLDGRPLLVDGGRDCGSVLWLARFVETLAQRGGNVTLRCPRALHRLLQHNFPGLQLLAPDADLPQHATPNHQYASLLGLPHRLEFASDASRSRPYLKAPQPRVDFYRKRIGNEHRLRVGLYWHNTHNRREPQHSMHLSRLLPLLHEPRLYCMSLQDGPAGEQIHAVPEGFALALAPREARASQQNDFQELASLMSALDIIIAVDSPIAHLAGALGLPVWIPLAAVPTPPWGIDGHCWYPQQRIFRQTRRNDFGPAIQQIREALQERLQLGHDHSDTRAVPT